MPRVQQKRGTSANLAAVNPVPLAGELVWESTENSIKIGDGSTAWTSLAYVTATPRIHKSTHATGGSDALTPADIGAAPAASPTFTGTANFGGVILAGDSTSLTAPVYSFTGDTNCGIARPAADTLSLVTDQTQRIRVRSDGNVGIGYDGAATHRLGVSGNIAGTGANIVCYGTGTAQPAATSAYGLWGQISIASGTTLSLLYNFYAIQGTYTGSCTLQAGFVVESTLVGATTNYGFRGRIPSGTGRWNLYLDGTAENYLAGNTGIGIATPSSALHVNGVITVAATGGSAGSYTPSLTFSGDSNTGFGQISGQSDTASIFTAGHERVRVDSSGRLGVATSTPTATLDVAADTMRLRTARTPASASATGNAGDICWDSSYLYVCTATNTWRRIAHSTW